MRTIAVLALAAACSAPPKKKNDLAEGTGDVPTTCCCKTIPVTDEKEIRPKYEMVGRMECSSQKGDCVDDVQCNGSQQVQQDQPKDNGVPPPPTLAPSTSSSGIP